MHHLNYKWEMKQNSKKEEHLYVYGYEIPL